MNFFEIWSSSRVIGANVNVSSLLLHYKYLAILIRKIYLHLSRVQHLCVLTSSISDWSGTVYWSVSRRGHLCSKINLQIILNNRCQLRFISLKYITMEEVRDRSLFITRGTESNFKSTRRKFSTPTLKGTTGVWQCISPSP